MDFENKAKGEIEVELRGLRGSYLSDYKEKKQREAMAEEERIQRELGEARLREKERLESFLLAEEQKKKEREALLERMKARLLGGDEPLIPKEVEAGKSYSELPSEINAPAEESLAEALSAEASEAAAVLCDEENEDNITAESLEDNSSEADAQMAALSFEEAPAVSDVEDEKISSDEAPIEEAHFDEEQPSAEEPRSEVREVDGRIILTVREVNAARANEPHGRFCIRIDGAEAPRVKVENENENLGQTAPRAEFSLPHEEAETARYDRRGDGLHDIDAELDAMRSSIDRAYLDKLNEIRLLREEEEKYRAEALAAKGERESYRLGVRGPGEGGEGYRIELPRFPEADYPQYTPPKDSFGASYPWDEPRPAPEGDVYPGADHPKATVDIGSDYPDPEYFGDVGGELRRDRYSTPEDESALRDYELYLAGKAEISERGKNKHGEYDYPDPESYDLPYTERYIEPEVDYGRAGDERSRRDIDELEREREIAGHLGDDERNQRDERASSTYSRAMLAGEIEKYEGRLSVLLPRLRDAVRASGSAPTAASLASEINLLSEEIALHSGILSLTVAVTDGNRASKYKSRLLDCVKRYNAALMLYSEITGEYYTPLDQSFVDSVEEGREVSSSLTVGFDKSEGDTSTRAKKKDLDKDKLRFAKASGHKDEWRVPEGGFNLIPCEIADKMRSRDVLVVRERLNYTVCALKDRRSALMQNFAVDERARASSVRALEKKLDKTSKNIDRAAKLEARDNERYFSLITEGEKIPQYKKNTDPEYLISIRERVRALLMERERINDRLLVLYTGGKDSGILKRARRTRLNSMRRAAKGQAYIAKAARAQNASHRLIEKLYSAINLRTELTARLDEEKYKRRHAPWRERSAISKRISGIKRDLRRANETVKNCNKSIKEEKIDREDRRTWARWVILTALSVAVLIAIWILFGDKIYALIQRLFGKGG